MELRNFIIKYGISHVIIARELGISRSTFSLKLREVHGQRLTEEQQEKVKSFILKLIEDAKSVSI